MESKLYEECHEGGGFMAQQAMLKQDETVRTQISRRGTMSEGHGTIKNNTMRTKRVLR